jgi:hypothetical protein
MAPEQRFGRTAEPLLVSFIDKSIPMLSIHRGDQHRERIGDQAQLRFAVARLALGCAYREQCGMLAGIGSLQPMSKVPRAPRNGGARAEGGGLGTEDANGVGPVGESVIDSLWTSWA